MGCDIHGVVERKWKGKWVAIRTLDHCHDGKGQFVTPAAKERNYERFAALAGVRGEGPPARGLPEDASETSAMRFETEGDHTPSWLPLKEATEIFRDTDWYLSKNPEQAQYANAYYFFGIEDENLDDYRLVFWFDS